MTSKRLALAAAFGLAVIAADLITKALARSELKEGQTIELPLGAHLQYGENSGMAFGLFASAGDVLLIVAVIAVAGVAILLLRLAAGAELLLPAALLLGGALANLADRVGDGTVTDFIDLGAWPSFNLADVAITIGVALLALALARNPTARPRGRSSKPLLVAPSEADSSGRTDGDDRRGA